MQNPVLSPDALKKTVHSKLFPWIVWGLGALLFFAEYSARVSPSAMNQSLMQAFHASGFQLGSLSAFFAYAYVPMQIPVGMLVDRYGARRLLTMSALLCAVSCFIFAHTNSLNIANATRFMLGFSASFVFVSSLKLASVWFPASRFGLLAGMTQALGMLGAAVGEAPIAAATEHFGWRGTILGLSFIFLIMGILVVSIIRSQPPGFPTQKRHTSWLSMFDGLGTVLRNPQTWINGCYVGFLYAPTSAFAELWGTRFLQTAYHLSLVDAAFAAGLIFIGWTFGGPLGGWLSDRMGRRKPLMIGSALCGFIILGLIIYVPHLPHAAILGLLFCYGLTNTGVAISYALSSEINPHRIAGTSMAFANMASVIIGMVFQPLIGWLLDVLSKGQVVNGVRVFSTADFRTALSFLPICMLIGLVTAFFVKETYCRPMAGMER